MGVAGVKESDSGERLVRPAMDEDQDWGKLLEENGPALVMYARQWTHSVSDAEDAVQEGFVRYWKSRRAGDDPVPCLYVSVRRSALDRRRSEARRDVREKKSMQEVDGVAWFSGLEIEEEERRKEVERALKSLPDEQREVLIMKIWGDLTFKQIAGALGESQNTVASRYRYGLEALRGVLDRGLLDDLGGLRQSVAPAG